MTLSYQVLRGKEVAGVIPDLARLRITVFRAWPYLYDGDAANEERYLKSYADNPRAVVVTARHRDQIVGAATGMPLEDHADSFGAALDGHDLPDNQIFYCAESVLIPACRGQGAGHVFFDEREAFGRTLGRRWSMFCGVVRPADHPARPPDYRPLDGFWARRGYAKLNGAIAHFGWRDLGQSEETEKPLQVWIKDLKASVL